MQHLLERESRRNSSMSDEEKKNDAMAENNEPKENEEKYNDRETVKESTC